MTIAPQAAVPQEKRERLARARAALSAAELRASRYGGSRERTLLRALPRPTEHSPSAADAQGRATAPSAGSALGARITEGLSTGEWMPVPPPLEGIIPHRNLRAGSSLAVQGPASSTLLLALAASAASEEDWCAIAGMPDLGLRAAVDAGLDPTRLAIITGRSTREQPRLPQILTALVDGVGVLVLGPDLELAPALWRSLTARARTQGVLLLAASPPGRADLTLRCAHSGWGGLHRGSGRLRTRSLEVIAEGRGLGAPAQTQVLMPSAQGTLEALPGTQSARPPRAERISAAAAAPVAAGQGAAPGGLEIIRRAG